MQCMCEALATDTVHLVLCFHMFCSIGVIFLGYTKDYLSTQTLLSNQ
jgi:hypothetical protein